jgi:hypothetical protein
MKGFPDRSCLWLGSTVGAFIDEFAKPHNRKAKLRYKSNMIGLELMDYPLDYSRI